jgi:hypothetical protein
MHVLVDDDGVFCIFPGDFCGCQLIEGTKFFALKYGLCAGGMQTDAIRRCFSIRRQQLFFFETANRGRGGHRQQLSAITRPLLAILTQFDWLDRSRGCDSGQIRFRADSD